MIVVAVVVVVVVGTSEETRINLPWKKTVIYGWPLIQFYTYYEKVRRRHSTLMKRSYPVRFICTY